MKKLFYMFAFASLLIVSCDSDSITDEFTAANGNVSKKLIERIEYNSAQNYELDYTFTVEYDVSDRVVSASNGIEETIFVYENNELSTVTGGGNPLSMGELYQSPYDLFETGDVLEYDQKGNPISVLYFEYDYGYNNGQYGETVEEFIATIEYDSTPNPFFYTLEAAGVIDVMDKVKFNFNMLPQSSEIVQAKQLFPMNNPKKITYRNEDGVVVGVVKMDYLYDSDNYPSSATFTVEYEGKPTRVYSARYFYR